MKKFLFLSLIVIPVLLGAQNQEFDTKQQYQQAMANAKQAFDAKQYSEAVLFYREAISIMPDARLPRYKIEDIRTIYIENELNDVQPKAVANTPQPKKKKNDLEQIKIDQEQAKAEATRKMNEDADKAADELRALPVESIEIKDDEVAIEDTKESVPSIEADQKIAVRPVKVIAIDDADVTLSDDKKTQVVDIEQDKQITKPEVKVIEIEDETITVENDTEIKVVETVRIKKDVPIQEKPKPIQKESVLIQQPQKMSADEKQVWIEKEKKRLAQIYPNKKTIEEIEKSGKQITRVIMNVENKVIIYLKVKHSWGAIYYFIDEVGQELRSINEQYFNLMTNLNTYGG